MLQRASWSRGRASSTLLRTVPSAKRVTISCSPRPARRRCAPVGPRRSASGCSPARAAGRRRRRPAAGATSRTRSSRRPRCPRLSGPSRAAWARTLASLDSSRAGAARPREDAFVPRRSPVHAQLVPRRRGEAPPRLGVTRPARRPGRSGRGGPGRSAGAATWAAHQRRVASDDLVPALGGRDADARRHDVRHRLVTGVADPGEDGLGRARPRPAPRSRSRRRRGRPALPRPGPRR